MKHELKIIMTFETEDMDHDSTTPITSHSIRVSMDGNIIGCIQKMHVSANCEEVLPEIEFTFPDFDTLDYDAATYKNMFPSSSGKPPFIRDIEGHIEALSLAPNIKVRKEGIDNGENIVHLEEVGTDGFIDSIPMNRRNK